MPDVFLSYSQKDRGRAEEVARRLKDAGWDVWWDVEVRVGSRFRAEITQHLQSAKCVVVLWSETSVDSDWVIDEADDGRKRGVLVQALLGNVDPPHGFRGIEWADLRLWDGDPQSPEFVRLVSGISRLVAATPSLHQARAVDREWAQSAAVEPTQHFLRDLMQTRLQKKLVWSVAALVTVVGLGTLALRPNGDQHPTITQDASPSRGIVNGEEETAVRIRFWIERLPRVPGADARELFINALGAWQAVVPTPITEATSRAEANVMVTTMKETIAQAELGPPRKGTAPLNIWFGTDVPWTPRAFQSASARMLGHVLGLKETNTPGQLMTHGADLETLPASPQAEDKALARKIWK